MSAHMSSVFVDYLDCTFSPEDNPIPEVEKHLLSFSGHCERPPFGSKSKVVWNVGSGKVVLNESAQFVRVSASGMSIDEMRSSGGFEEYVRILGTARNKVTRLDVAVDLYSDAPPIIARLRRRYPRTCKLSHKPVKTRWFGSTREDGAETGTFYVGDRRTTKVTAACYDKQAETLERCGLVIPPTMRYELRVKSGVKATLVDALDPSPMFWHYAGGTLLPRPDDHIREWVQGRKFEPWVNSWLPSTPAASMINRVNGSPELLALSKLALECGPHGREMLDRLIRDELDRLMGPAGAADACRTSSGIQPEPTAKETLTSALRT